MVDMIMYRSIITHAIAAFLASFAVWLWHDVSISKLKLNQKTQEVKTIEIEKKVIAQDAKDSTVNAGDYIKKLKDANNEIANLRAGLSSGAIKLRNYQSAINDAKQAENNSAAAKAEADANSAADRERIISLMEKAKELDAWSNSCWEWVNRNQYIN